MVKLDPKWRQTKFLDWYMARIVNFGGEFKTVAEVYRWFEENCYPQKAAELWLLGHFRTEEEANHVSQS